VTDFTISKRRKSYLKMIRRPKFVASCLVSRNYNYYLTNVYSFNFLITILSLTLFVIDFEKAERRISGTFTLILTSFSFKIVNSKTLPTISYLTSLDKYQIANIVYLGICCVWHSILASLNVSFFKHTVENLVIANQCRVTFFNRNTLHGVALGKNLKFIRHSIDAVAKFRILILNTVPCLILILDL